MTGVQTCALPIFTIVRHQPFYIGKASDIGYQIVTRLRPMNVIYVTFIVPVGAPGKVLDGTVSDTEITVSWEPVPADETNGQLLGYKV